MERPRSLSGIRVLSFKTTPIPGTPRGSQRVSRVSFITLDKRTAPQKNANNKVLKSAYEMTSAHAHVFRTSLPDAQAALACVAFMVVCEKAASNSSFVSIIRGFMPSNIEITRLPDHLATDCSCRTRNLIFLLPKKMIACLPRKLSPRPLLYYPCDPPT